MAGAAAVMIAGLGGMNPAWAKTPDAADASLQAMIDAAKPQQEVVVPPGSYSGPIVIRKPITLKASGSVTITSPDQGPIVTVETDGAVVAGFALIDSRENVSDSVAVYVHGSGNRLEQLSIRTHGFGVRLKEAHRNRLTGLDIEGLAAMPESSQEEPPERGNGIDLWGSHDNVISGNRIRNMFDGIYMESSESNVAEQNAVSHSRYGYHLMFCKDTVVRSNEGMFNVTGAMVMSDKGAQVLNNNFAKQSENATAQGILLFDVTGATVSGNRVEGNRVGLFGQSVSDTVVKDNLFVRNFTGMQLTGAERNEFRGNYYIANVVQAQADAGASNRIAFNYWDDHEGLDWNGDGVSDLAYRANPFFLHLTDQVPAYQLFFGSPGMGLLEQLFQTRAKDGFSDPAPLMKPELPADAGGRDASRIQLLVCGGLLALSAASIFTLGGRKK